jgi:GNAT superfamily N-acetyltransferase
MNAKNREKKANIIFYYKKPCDLPQGYLDKICRLVETGGSVSTKYVRYNLEKAYLIAYAMENKMIIGNSSLKHPRKEFIQRIKNITGFDFTNFIERGYTSVRPEYRAMGIGTRLLGGLTKRAGDYKIFSIISEDNKATQKIALRNKTRKIATYFSQKTGKEMGLWMPEHMVEKKWNINK